MAPRACNLMNQMVRDRRTGLVGRVIGIVEWADSPSSLVVQPPVLADQSVPSSVYVPVAASEIMPHLADPRPS